MTVDSDPRPPLPPAEPVVRVRVLRLSAAEEGGEPIRLETEDDWIQLSCPKARPGDPPESLNLTPGQPDPGTLWNPAVADDETVTLRSPILIELCADRWRVVDGWGGRAEVDPSLPVEFSPAVSPESGIRVWNRGFPGALRIHALGDADERTIEVINHVAMESYLPGVLAGELYSHWRLQTHVAQAVAARSFACCEQAYFASRRHYDVTDTARSQMYRGAEVSDRAVEAVQMTRGQVLVWQDRLVPGYYSSCCGGTAARAVDVIGPNPVNDIPPLYGRSGSDICSAAPRYRWEVSRPIRLLTQRLVAYGEQRGIKDLTALARVTSIEVAEQNEHGRPISYAITDRRDHRAEIPARTLRFAANFGDEDLDRPEKPLHSSHVEVTIIGRTATFDGRGHGHGAGLCQYGAQALAAQGGEYESILRWYYPEVEIEQAYV
ncbi:MAG: SpoIID/LytB domain-containing protein [Phycisphaerales bacterium]|nr:MAG: SpoIID/LytB domain-containing protein [Phycisphaerales bacterium]